MLEKGVSELDATFEDTDASLPWRRPHDISGRENRSASDEPASKVAGSSSFRMRSYRGRLTRLPARAK
jgi:hypothetical protein